MAGLFPFFWIDAFTSTPLLGNPCAVVLDADGLDDAQMQRIAREMNLSETAFVTASDVADFGARYFTPAEEIPLAGHPTLSATRALLDSGRLPAASGGFTLELRDGPIRVDLRPLEEDRVLIAMTQRPPTFHRVYERAAVAPAFGLEAEDLDATAAPQTASTGTPQLMVPVTSLAALRRARMDVEVYRALKEKGDFFSPHLFVREGATPEGDTFARHFGMPPDTPEDPFTGSATGGMAAYLWRHGLLDRPRFVAEQGHDMGRAGSAIVEIEGPPGRPELVCVAGEAVTVVRGEIAVRG